MKPHFFSYLTLISSIKKGGKKKRERRRSEFDNFLWPRFEFKRPLGTFTLLFIHLLKRTESFSFYRIEGWRILSCKFSSVRVNFPIFLFNPHFNQSNASIEFSFQVCDLYPPHPPFLPPSFPFSKVTFSPRSSKTGEKREKYFSYRGSVFLFQLFWDIGFQWSNLMDKKCFLHSAHFLKLNILTFYLTLRAIDDELNIKITIIENVIFILSNPIKNLVILVIKGDSNAHKVGGTF